MKTLSNRKQAKKMCMVILMIQAFFLSWRFLHAISRSIFQDESGEDFDPGCFPEFNQPQCFLTTTKFYILFEMFSGFQIRILSAM